MRFRHFIRRLHLYLALLLLPWFLMYGISSLFFSHPDLGEDWYDDGVPLWTPRFERSYDVAVGDDLGQLADRIVEDNGLMGSYGAYRQSPDQINVYVHTFWTSTRVMYYPGEKRLVAEDRRFRWDHFFTGMHARGGFNGPLPLDSVWAAVVDLVCLAFLVWIVTGFVMWWQVRGVRFWGWMALGGGVACFGLFLVFL